MNSFLDNVAKNIIDENYDFHNIKIILPSNRASLVLRNKLINKIKKPVISPDIISISEFINELSGIKKIENTSVVFELYLIYRKIIPKKDQQNFDEFTGWASILINDFNLIDSYLVDPNSLFSSMISAQEINEWAQNDNLDSKTKLGLKFWKNVPVLYSSLRTHLIKNKIGTNGMLFREAIKHLELYMTENNKFHYFIGFNMLNTAESNIIQEFISQKKGKVLWDLDKEFFEDNKHSAGNFIRSYYKKWKCLRGKKPEGLSSNYKKNKTFHIIQASNKISQSKFVGQILNDWKYKNDLYNKAVVLGNDKTLFSVLSGINLNTDKWNVTMGLPISNSSISSLIDVIFQMHINAFEEKYTFDDVLSILNDIIVSNQLKKEKINLKNLISDLQKYNYSLFPQCTLYNSKESFQYILFKGVKSSSELLKKLNNLIKYLEKADHFKEAGSFILKEINIIKNIIVKLFNYSEKIKNIPFKVLHSIFKESFKENKLNFSGDSSSSLQIMSLPETRLIDFDSVVITNVNEGILPKGKSNDSFLPFDIKKHFQLPTFLDYDDKDAYQFYRLIQNVNDLYLLYSISEKGLGGTEKSRFIYQLEHFLKPNHKLNFLKIKTSFKKSSIFKVDKSNEIIDILKLIVKRGLSPSALTSFMTNPLEFYYKRILKIRDFDNLYPVIEPKDKGNIVHETMEEIYKPFLNKEITLPDYQLIINELPHILEEKFKLIYGGNPKRTGYNYLIYEELLKQCNELFITERTLIEKGNKLNILSLEKKIEYNIEIEGLTCPVKIIGTIDRIDQWNGQLRILDYKTGSVNIDRLRFSSNFSFNELKDQRIKEYRSLFQLLLYSYVYFKQNSLKSIQAGIIPLKSPKDYFYPISTSFYKRNGAKSLLSFETFEQFEIELAIQIKNLFDENIPFMANDSD